MYDAQFFFGKAIHAVLFHYVLLEVKGSQNLCLNFRAFHFFCNSLPSLYHKQQGLLLSLICLVFGDFCAA